MKRTIIQLTEEQHRFLRELAAEYHVSVSEMVRRSVDALAQNKPRAHSREEIRRRAMAAAGFIKDPNGPHDISVNHDYYLEEIYAEENQDDNDLH
jgi:Arc/MetJ-type ribon-helix-helix transcriptional regulator